MRIPFIGEAYSSQDVLEDTVNWFPETNTRKQVQAFIPCPGLALLQSINPYPCRGLHIVSADETKMYGVFGNGFYQILADLSFNKIGELNSSEGLVGIADNGLEIMIVDGTPNNGYIYTIATGALISVPATSPTTGNPNVFPGADSITFRDGYLITNDPGTEDVRCSDIKDAKTWNGLNTAPVEGDPDHVVRVQATQTMVLMYGTLSLEVYLDAALDTGFPFVRMAGGIIPWGLSAKNALVDLQGVAHFLARTDKGERVIAALSGLMPQVVSHPGINYQLGKMVTIADCEAFSYMQDGHPFAVFTFPNADVTYVYDRSTNQWHRRKSYGMGRWRARCYAFFQGMHIVGDFQSGNLYQVSMTETQDNGKPIEYSRIAPEIVDEDDDYKNIFINEIQLDVEIRAYTPGDDAPLCTMQASRDNGKTWGPLHTQPLRKQGDFSRRLMFHRWGKARRRSFKFATTTKMVIRRSWIDAQNGIN